MVFGLKKVIFNVWKVRKDRTESVAVIS